MKVEFEFEEDVVRKLDELSAKFFDDSKSDIVQQAISMLYEITEMNAEAKPFQLLVHPDGTPEIVDAPVENPE